MELLKESVKALIGIMTQKPFYRGEACLSR